MCKYIEYDFVVALIIVNENSSCPNLDIYVV